MTASELELRDALINAFEAEYGDSWQRHSGVKDQEGNWLKTGESQEHHDICPWPNLNHVLDIAIQVVDEKIGLA